MHNPLIDPIYDELDIPEFLSVENRKPLPEGFVLPKPSRSPRESKRRWDLPKSVDAEGLKLYRQSIRERETKKVERLKSLRQRKGKR